MSVASNGELLARVRSGGPRRNLCSEDNAERVRRSAGSLVPAPNPDFIGVYSNGVIARREGPHECAPVRRQ
jgi:hypothetical protein